MNKICTVLFSVIILLISSCKKEKSEPVPEKQGIDLLVGKWKYERADSYRYINDELESKKLMGYLPGQNIIFNTDGTGVETLKDSELKDIVSSFKYNFSGDTLTISDFVNKITGDIIPMEKPNLIIVNNISPDSLKWTIKYASQITDGRIDSYVNDVVLSRMK